MKSLITAILAVILLSACANQNEDKVQTVDKDGSVEMSVSVKHINNIDVLKTESNIWYKNNLLKQIVKTDTIPSLGTTKETAENEDGDDTTVSVPKNYQLFITVK